LSRRKRTPRRRSRKKGYALGRVQHRLLAVLSAFSLPLLVFFVFSGWYALPRYSNTWSFPPTTVYISSPLYLTVNTEEEVRVVIRNTSSDAVHARYQLNSASVFVVVAHNDGSGSNVIWDGVLSGLEQVERKLQIFIPYDYWGGHTSHTLGWVFELSISSNLVPLKQGETPKLLLSTAPIPWIPAIFKNTRAMLGVIFVWFFKEWWDIYKKQVERYR